MKTLNFKCRIMLTVIMLVISFSGFAQFSGGNGTADSPYIITTPAQLAQLATLVNAGNTDYHNKHYKLGNDIDLSDYQSGEGWKPIGQLEMYSMQPSFEGVFDGNNKKITNLYINNDSSSFCVGLFGLIHNSTIKNLGLVNINVTSNVVSYMGGLVGQSWNSNISNCYSTGIVSSSSSDGNTRAGGIVGQNSGSIISNCYSICTVSAFGYSYVGGIIGTNNGTVSNCYSTGAVSARIYVGGIAGESFVGNVSNNAALNPSITSCQHFGRVSTNTPSTFVNNIGFINMLNPDGNTTWTNKGINDFDGADITIETILSDGTIGGRFTSANGWTTQNGKLPGLAGNTVDIPEHLFSSANFNPVIFVTNITNVPATATAGIPLTLTGTVIPSDATNQNIIWSVVNAGSTGTSINGNTFLATSAGTAIVRATISNGVSICTDYTKEFYISCKDGTGTTDCNGTTWDGTRTELPDALGTQSNPIPIECAGHLAQLAYEVNNGIGATMVNGKSTVGAGIYYELKFNLDLNNLPWTPIGNEQHSFGGHFSGGRGVTISNLYINSSILQYAGLFGVVNGGSIKDLGIIGESSITIDKIQWWNTGAGAIVGYAEGGVVIDNCYNTGSVKGSEAGGIIGFAGLFTVNNCHNSGSIYASTGDPHAGGIVGQTEWGYGNGTSTISNCYNTGSVYAGMGPGGIIGENNRSLTISNCYNIGLITGTFAAGIIGENKNSLTINCCYNLGDISDGSDIGGIIGSNEGTPLTISNCYNRATVTNASETGGIVGRNRYSNNSLMITDCYNMGYISGYSSGGLVGGNENNTITITNSYNAGTIEEGEYASAIIGRNESPSLLTINNCHYLNTSVNNSGGSTPQTEQFMKTQDFVDILGNSFDSDQMPYINQGYPVLLCTNIVNAIENIKDKSNIAVYPNPAKEVLIIKNEELRMENYSIFNVSGQILMQGALSTETTNINVKELPSGMYFVKVGDKTGKFIKE